jgi:hypothetical protein
MGAVHEIKQTETGSDKTGRSNVVAGRKKRRAQGECRSSPCFSKLAKGGSAKGGLKTTWYCEQCRVFLHPGQCFDAHHSQSSSDMRKFKANPTLNDLVDT